MNKLMRNIRFFVGLIILGSIGLVALMGWRTLAPPEGRDVPGRVRATSADLQLDRLRYTETREGKKEWELEAATAQYFKEENSVILDKVKATFFGKNGETYILRGEKGKFNTRTKAIEVFDGIELDSSDGYHLRTKRLRYQAEKRELSTSDPVEMNGPQIRVEGIGLIVELDHQRLKVLRQVTTTLSQLAVEKFLRSAR
ncbi:MAG: LPS export ABC transporter periplasmic protein LptC [Deltaproteobacteria bacterium]|nr:LPS export ABC transporter periplasmic protein LptC [Deltaproteobacteria bacterium]